MVISYRDGGNSDYGTAIVGEVDASNNTISFGTPVVFESDYIFFTSIDFDSTANKVLIAYEDAGNSGYGTAIVGTVDSSDNSISFGSAAVFESAAVQYITTRFDPDNSKFLIVYEDEGNSQYGTAIVATISGTSVSFGSATVYASVATDFNSCIYDTNANKFLVTYRNWDVGGYGIVGTISGTSVSFGSATGFHTSGSTIYVNGTTGRYGMSFDSTLNKIVIAYQAYVSSTIGYVVVGTISGTSVSFGSYVALDSAEKDWANTIAYDSNTNKHLIMNYDASEDPDHTNIREVTVSGTTPTVGDQILVSDLRESTNNAMVFDSNAKKLVIAYAFGGNSNYGTANVIQTSGTVNSLTSENFIGFAKDAVADGAVATIQTANSIARDNIETPSSSSTLGSEVTFENANSNTYKGATYDSNTKRVVIAYEDQANSEYGTAVVGTVSGTSISFGTPVVYASVTNAYVRSTFDSSNNKVVIAYQDDTNEDVKAIVGTVDSSDNSISFGSATQFNAAKVGDVGVCFDSSNNKVVIAYRDYGNSNYGTAIVGTVSSTSISFGSEAVFESATTDYSNAVFDSNSNKVVIFYKDGGNSNYGTSIVGTVSSTSISFGSAVVFESAASTGDQYGAAFDTTANKTVVVYKDGGDSNKLKGIVGTVSGTSISYGSAADITTNAASYPSAVYMPDANKTLVAYTDEGASIIGVLSFGTISGTDISFSTPETFRGASDYTTRSTTTYDTENKVAVIAYVHGSGSSFLGKAKVLSASGTPSDLTIGQQYFVQTDGTLSTSADDPSVIAGTAISGTDLIVKG